MSTPPPRSLLPLRWELEATLRHPARVALLERLPAGPALGGVVVGAVEVGVATMTFPKIEY